MSRRRTVLVGIAVTLLAGLAAGQEHPERIGLWNEDRNAWISAFHADAVAATSGSVAATSGSEIYYSTGKYWTVKRIEDQAADFDQRFGSAKEHGLEEGTYPSLDFCEPEPEVAILGQGPFPETQSLDGTLLLAEVAATATVSEIIPGFSRMGGPMILLVLSDVTTLTDRSPVPAYALLRVRSMVIHDKVFCDRDVHFTYQPQVGDRIVAIGSWDRGVVTFGPKTTSLFGKIDGSGTPHWQSWNVPSYDVGDLASVVARLNQMESEGLLSTTRHLSRLEYMAAERHEFADALGHSECPVSRIDTGTDGRLSVDVSCTETNR